MSSEQHHHRHQPQTITRTRQDLINSGELFRLNEKPADDKTFRGQRGSRSRSESVRKGLTECCYSTSNLFLIIATVIALILLIRFLQDEPLAKYLEYLLSLSFYRQLIYVIVIMPFVLLVPIFNALSALILISQRASSATSEKPTSNSKAILKVKLFYQAILILLVFLALVFVAPYVKSANLSSQIELELRNFMSIRYNNDFAYKMLNDIQGEYQCCDQMWYRANLRDQLPLSCFVADTNFSVFYDQTCSEALNTLIGVRCYMISGCLLVILVALACLFSIDLVESLVQASGHYEVHPDSPPQVNRRLSPVSSDSTHKDSSGGDRLLFHDYDDDDDADERDVTARSPYREPSIAERLKLDERERDTPLLGTPASHYDDDQRAIPAKSQTRTTFGTSKPARLGANLPFDSDSTSLTTRSQGSGAVDPCQPPTSSEPILLARAQYQLVRRERSQSPMFVSPNPEVSNADELADEPRGQDSRADRRPIKSALKKTTSNSSNIDHDHESSTPARFGPDEYRAHGRLEDDISSDDDYTERLRQSDSLLRQKQLQREQQTRRSLMSVRFADD